MKIIGITGYDRCGKDTLANMLSNKLSNYGKVVIFPLARALKHYVSDILDIDMDTLENMKNNEEYVCIGNRRITMRDTLILFSQNMKKYIDKNVWSIILLNNIDKDIDYLIIPDIRYKEEELYLRKYDTIIIKLKSNLPNCKKNNKEYEVNKIKYDVAIYNKYKDNSSLLSGVESVILGLKIDIINKK